MEYCSVPVKENYTTQESIKSTLEITNTMKINIKVLKQAIITYYFLSFSLKIFIKPFT